MSDIKKELPISPEIPIEEKKPKGKIEILADIKKAIEKNGYEISEDELLLMIEKITRVGTASKTFSLDTKSIESEIKVFPKKRIYIEKYDDVFDFNDMFFDEVIENFNNPKLVKTFIDIEHKLGEKYAEVISLEKKEDGLYAKIKWNENGKELITSNKYSYVSPEWGDRVDTEKIPHKNVLCAITLTNIPALETELPKLQAQVKLSRMEDNKNMESIKLRLSKLEGKISNFKLAEEPVALPPELLEALAMLKEVMAKIDELTQQKEVAEEQAQEAQAKLSAIEVENEKKEKELFFENAVKDGQVEMKELDMWKEHYNKSKDFVKKFIASRSKKNDNQKTLSMNIENSKKLEKEDYFVMDQYNYKKADGSYDIDRYSKEILGGK